MTLLGWMVYGVAVGLLVSGAGWCLERAANRTGLPSRWVWAGALALSVGLPLTALAGGAGAAPGDAVEAVALLPATAVTGGAAEADRDPRSLAAWAAAARAGTLATIERAAATLNGGLARGAEALPAAPGVDRAAAGVWAAGSAALGIFLLVSMAQLGRRRAQWPRARVLGRRVRIAPELGPAVMGLARPEIVLPRWATRLEAGELEVVLAHEDEHVRARDPLLLAAGLAVVLALPWNPVAWWQLRRLRDAVEVDCDRRVLRAGIPPRRYGTVLVRLGGRGWKDLLPATPLGGSPSLLERRLNAMKTRSIRRALPLALLAAVAATGLLVLACEADTPTRPAEDAALAGPEVEVGQAESLAEGVDEGHGFRLEGDAIRFDGAPLFVVDGVIVGEDIARDLDSEAIHQIEVVKGAAALERYGERAGAGVVLIRTQASEAGPVQEGPPPPPEEITISPMPEHIGEAPEGASATSARDEGSGRALPFMVQRVNPDGSPGEVLPEIQVRGASGTDSGPRPLYIVDGVIVNWDRIELDPEEIDSIEVIRGAAAAERYGSRAANGVIQITTKRD